MLHCVSWMIRSFAKVSTARESALAWASWNLQTPLGRWRRHTVTGATRAANNVRPQCSASCRIALNCQQRLNSW